MKKNQKQVGKPGSDHHETLCEFFTEILGLDEKNANKGARKIERAIAPVIIQRIVEYTENMKSSSSQKGDAKSNPPCKKSA